MEEILSGYQAFLKVITAAHPIPDAGTIEGMGRQVEAVRNFMHDYEDKSKAEAHRLIDTVAESDRKPLADKINEMKLAIFKEHIPGWAWKIIEANPPG